MTRSIARLLVVIASCALALGIAPSLAAAQDADVDTPVPVVPEDTRPHYDPDGAGSHFALPDISIPDDADTVGGTGGGDATAGLAVTGTEVEPVAAISIGLLAVGGSVLVVSRRRLSEFV